MDSFGVICPQESGLCRMSSGSGQSSVELLLMKFDHHAYAAIEGSRERAPRDLVSVLASIGQARGVLSEADQDKLPNHAELSFALQSLIEAGKIAEASPHRYYDTDGRSPRRTFSGVPQSEYEKACAEYYHRLHQGLDVVHGWKLDVAGWPGPDRRRWGIDHDVILPSPDGQFACVLYSCAEVRMGWTVGLLALLKGPRDKPTVILRPPNFTCNVGRRCIQWLEGSRYCVVTPYLFSQADNRVELLAYTFLDIIKEAFAHVEIRDTTFLEQEVLEEGSTWVIPDLPDASQGRGARRLTPAHLSWHSWQDLIGTSSAPSPESLRGCLFVETPFGPAVQASQAPESRARIGRAGGEHQANQRRAWWQFWK
jgi:hypothetical protein